MRRHGRLVDKEVFLRVNTNVNALHANRRLQKVERNIERNFNDLSGDKIMRSSYDPTGLAISSRMDSTLRSSQQALRNSNDTVSLVQVGEGALGEIGNMTSRLRELAIAASSDTIGEQRSLAQLEFGQLKAEIGRIVETTEFNGQKMLSASSGHMDFQIGVNNSPEIDRVKLDLKDVFSNLHSNENLAASKSRIRDTDFAAASADRVRLGIMEAGSTTAVQLSTSQIKDQVLKLL
jgi:flagellin